MKSCPKCGAQRVGELPFCAACGADLRPLDAAVAAPAMAASDPGGDPPMPAFAPGWPVPVRSPGSRRVGLGVVLALVAVTALIGVGAGIFVGNSLMRGASSSAAPSMTGPGNGVLATPEAAVQQYMNGVATNDADEILRACGIDLVAKGFQFDLYAERLNAILPGTMLAPSQYPLYATINEYQQSYRIFEQVRNFAYSLLSSEPLDQTITPVTAAQVQQYAKDVDPSRLASLKVASVKFPIASLASDSKTLANFAAQAKVYGADEMTERLALFQWNGKYYEAGFQLLRYGQGWLVVSQTSYLAGLDATGAPKATTPDDFDAATGS